MKLADYLTQADVSLSEFARRIGAHNARTVQRYTKHGRIPSGTMMAAIQRETGGKVQPNDFFASDEG
jgi:DNA-binding transcriptional regulator YdaS (Cro superfamily)